MHITLIVRNEKLGSVELTREFDSVNESIPHLQNLLSKTTWDGIHHLQGYADLFGLMARWGWYDRGVHKDHWLDNEYRILMNFGSGRGYVDSVEVYGPSGLGYPEEITYFDNYIRRNQSINSVVCDSLTVYHSRYGHNESYDQQVS